MGLWAWNWALDVFGFVLRAFQQILDASGLRFVYLVMILAAIVYRLLVAPLVGVALREHGSDVYRKSKARRDKATREIQPWKGYN